MSNNCGCSDNIVSPSNCGNCLETCTGEESTTQCIQYVGPDLTNLLINSGQGLNDVLYNINGLGITSLYVVKVVIPSLNVKLLFTQPFTIIPAPGTNKIINILSTSCMIEGDNSVAYTVSGDNLNIKSENATNAGFKVSDTVLTYTNTFISSSFSPQSTTDIIRVNDNIVLYHDTANPTLGTGDLALYITYVVNDITL